MWWFLIIVFVVVAAIWQIPAVGPFVALALICAVVWFFWWSMREDRTGLNPERFTNEAREKRKQDRRNDQAKINSRTHHAEIRARIDPTRATPENLERIQRERLQHDQVYANRIDAARIAGEIEGQHYTKWAPIIDKLKREGKIFEALELCLACIDAAERQSRVDGLGVPPGYTRNAAILYRRMKDYDGEVAVLERYERSGNPHSDLAERLVKARLLRDRARSTE